MSWRGTMGEVSRICRKIQIHVLVLPSSIEHCAGDRQKTNKYLTR